MPEFNDEDTRARKHDTDKRGQLKVSTVEIQPRRSRIKRQLFQISRSDLSSLEERELSTRRPRQSLEASLCRQGVRLMALWWMIKQYFLRVELLDWHSMLSVLTWPGENENCVLVPTCATLMTAFIDSLVLYFLFISRLIQDIIL